MQYVLAVIAAPIVIVVMLLIARWLDRPRTICRSTTDLFRSVARKEQRGESLIECTLLLGYAVATAIVLMPGFAERIQRHTTLAIVAVRIMGIVMIALFLGLIARYRLNKSKC